MRMESEHIDVSTVVACAGAAAASPRSAVPRAGNSMFAVAARAPERVSMRRCLTGSMSPWRRRPSWHAGRQLSACKRRSVCLTRLSF